MILYNDIEFLEFFDEEKYLDKEAGIVEYIITARNGVSLNIYMNIYEDIVCFRLTLDDNMEITSFGLYNITLIKFDKSNLKSIKLLFFQENKTLPVIVASIKPNISLSLGIFTIE